MAQDIWTDERIETAKRLWTSGLSAAQVAKQMGCGLSRAAINGKLYRLGLTREPGKALSPGPEPRTGGRRTRLVASKPQFAPPPPAPDSTISAIPRGRVYTPPPPPKPLPLVVETDVASDPRVLADLRSHMCRWPINDPGAGNGERMLFCARAVNGEKAVYCKAHAAVAFSASANRKSGNDYARSLRRYA